MRFILSLVLFVGALGFSENVFAYQDDQQAVSSEEVVGGDCNSGFNKGVCLSTGKYSSNRRVACRCR